MIVSRPPLCSLMWALAQFMPLLGTPIGWYSVRFLWINMAVPPLVCVMLCVVAVTLAAENTTEYFCVKNLNDALCRSVSYRYNV